MLKKRRRSKTVQIKKITVRHIIKITKSKTEIFKKEIAQYLDNNGFLSWSSKEKKYLILGTNSPKKGLVSCPECKVGELMVIRSRTTRNVSWVVLIFMMDAKHHHLYYKKQECELQRNHVMYVNGQS